MQHKPHSKFWNVAIFVLCFWTFAMSFYVSLGWGYYY
jgi:hypothetical protein